MQVQGTQKSGPHTTPVKSPRSKRVLPPTGTIESINLDAVPTSVPRLDNTAAKHKLSVKPKNQRVSRKHRRFTQVSHRKVNRDSRRESGFVLLLTGLVMDSC